VFAEWYKLQMTFLDIPEVKTFLLKINTAACWEKDNSTDLLHNSVTEY